MMLGTMSGLGQVITPPPGSPITRPVPAGYQGPRCNLPPCTTAMCPMIEMQSYLPPCNPGDALYSATGTMLNTQNNVNTAPVPVLGTPGQPIGPAETNIFSQCLASFSTGVGGMACMPVLAIAGGVILLFLLTRSH